MKERNFPKKVVVTAGMPYGNKPLHLGHANQFILSDFYARYMRDRIGKENVLYLSGTDGFGSTSAEKHRKLVEEGKTTQTVSEYVEGFNQNQRETLQKYDIALNNFYASCLEPALSHHTEISAYFFEEMLKNGKLQKRVTEQFFDEKYGVVLNGRQVEGKCPVEGCCSEVGYADECALGHQYNPRDLIDPVSTLSGTTPVFKDVTNYYFPLDEYRENLMNLLNEWKEKEITHKFIFKEMRDYMVRPAIYIKEDEKSALDNVELPQTFELRTDEKKKRVELVFNNVADRDVVSDILKEKEIKYTTNKSLAPLRITGNLEWGVKVPEVEEESKGLTFYVWPESLWAPISFTKTYLNENNSAQNWRDWWCDKDTSIVQFLGEDNIYFYCLAEPALFMAVNGKENNEHPKDGELQMPTMVATKHILLDGVKASSSGKARAPTADEMLEYYTPEQLRCYFLSLNTNSTACNFKSKAFYPEDFEGTGDPMLAPGNMLTNIFNRLVRSVIYSCQTIFDGKIPAVRPSQKTIENCINVVEQYQDKVEKFKFSEVMVLLDEFFRAANQDWSVRSKLESLEEKEQLIADSIHIIKTGVALVHPIAPKGSELVAKYMKAGDKLFDWANIEKTFDEICPEVDSFEFLEPKFDFFKKHHTQV